MSRQADIIIAGGGIMGLSLAWELMQLRQLNIYILEQRFTGYGATGRNIGRIRTSQFTKDLAIFAKNAFAKHQSLADQLGFNTLFWTPGYALVFYEHDEMEHMESICSMLRGLGHNTEFHNDAEVFDRLPILKGGEKPLGTLIHPDASVHHDALLYGYRLALKEKGCTISENKKIDELITSNSRICGVRTAEEEIHAPIVVNACGSWSSELSEGVGLKVPNKPYRREVLVSESSRAYMDTMITFYRPLEGWFHQTLRGETVIGVVHPDEPPGRNFSASHSHIGRAAEHIIRKAPKLRNLKIVRQWAGCYDITPDRKPLIGPVNLLPGLVQANGFSGRGIALIPYIAELLATWMVSESRPDELAAFDTNRFEGREDTQITMGDYYVAYKKINERNKL